MYRTKHPHTQPAMANTHIWSNREKHRHDFPCSNITNSARRKGQSKRNGRRFRRCRSNSSRSSQANRQPPNTSYTPFVHTQMRATSVELEQECTYVRRCRNVAKRHIHDTSTQTYHRRAGEVLHCCQPAVSAAVRVVPNVTKPDRSTLALAPCCSMASALLAPREMSSPNTTGTVAHTAPTHIRGSQILKINLLRPVTWPQGLRSHCVNTCLHSRLCVLMCTHTSVFTFPYALHRARICVRLCAYLYIILTII